MGFVDDWGIREGFRKGLRTFFWLLKIMVPISFGTALLQWSGLLNKADFILAPVMSLLSLPPQAALPLIISMLAGPGPAIAAMAVLDFNEAQLTLMGIYVLICHGLPQETIIQAKAGYSPFKAVIFRILAACLTVMAVAPFWPDSTAIPTAVNGVATAAGPFMAMVEDWAWMILDLTLTILGLVVVFMLAIEAFRARGWIEPLVRLLSPLLRAMGLSRQVGLLWVAACVFGLAFGAAVIVEEAKSGKMTKEELDALHLSIGINHGFIDDPALFMSIGVSYWWLLIPRLIMAMLAARLMTLWYKMKKGN